MSGSISPGGLTWIEKCEISLDQDIGWLNINIFDYAEPWTENLEEMLFISSIHNGFGASGGCGTRNVVMNNVT